MKTYIHKLHELRTDLNDTPVFKLTKNVWNFLNENHDSLYQSFKDMIKSDLFNLPFHKMIIESEINEVNVLSFCILTQLETEKLKWFTFEYVVYNQNSNKLFVANAFPTFNIMDNEFSWGDTHYMTDENEFPTEARFQLVEINDDELRTLRGNFIQSLLFAIPLMKTKGIERQEIAAPKIINKMRTRKGKPAIPAFTLIKIGRVFNRDGSSNEFDERKPTRVHWRRGHLRRVATGVGRINREYRWIEACLVNYVDGPEPTYNAKVIP